MQTEERTFHWRKPAKTWQPALKNEPQRRPADLTHSMARHTRSTGWVYHYVSKATSGRFESLTTPKLILFFFTVVAISIATAQDIAQPNSQATVSSTIESEVRKESLIPTAAGNKLDNIKWTDIVAAWCAVAGALVGGVAAIVAAKSARYSLLAVQQADATEKERAKVARAERMSNLWETFQQIKHLDEELKKRGGQELADIVLRNINNMGMIGFWWDANLIDRDITAEEIAVSYMTTFEQIEGLGEISELGRDGTDLISENPHAKKLYAIFKERLDKKARNSVTNPSSSNHPSQ
jgi:hypothetical protein